MDPDTPVEENPGDFPSHKIEKARSSRSRCKVCRRPIQKEKLRLGILIQGPFGPGYLWHHLACAARRRWDDVEQAYEAHCWSEDIQDLPTLAALRKQAEQKQREKAEQRQPPYAEHAPTGRSRCKHCGEPIEKGAFRVILLRNVEFSGQVRAGPVKVHPACVARELQTDHCATPGSDFEEELRTRSDGLEPADLNAVMEQIGPLPEA